MSKKIKKHLKRSMPWLLITSLIISSIAVGLVFNLNVKIYKLAQDKNVNLGLSLFRAQAQTNDWASTTVEVRNAPPQFEAGGEPEESPTTSTSTTPVNIGGSISFAATGDDPEDNDYFLLVCGDAVGATANSHDAPTCDGVSLCVSASTTDETPSTCTYSPVTDPPGEIQEWYAYVCDAHDTDPFCGIVSQGSGYAAGADEASPFYVNHAPAIDLTLATIDNLEAGGAFEFTATSTDQDTIRGGDILTTYFCDNAGWASGGCLGSTFCVATSTSGGTAVATSCPWTSSIPTQDNTYDFYVYIEDQFGLPAANNGTSSTYTIINSRPTVSGSFIFLQPTSGNHIVLNLKGNTTAVTASTTKNEVYDKNGCTDIVGATSTIYWQNAAGGYGCAANDDDCYQIANTSCIVEDCAGASDSLASVTCTTTMAFHAIPTDDSANASTTTWLAAIFAYDEEGAVATSSWTGTDVQTNPAIGVTEPLIDYNVLTPGTNTGTSTATTTITVLGNCPVDTYLYGTDMLQTPYSMDISQQKHDLLYNFDYSTQGTNATDTPSTNLEDLTVIKPTTAAPDQIDYVYWGIGIPLSQHSGVYDGANTFQVWIDDDGAW